MMRPAEACTHGRTHVTAPAHMQPDRQVATNAIHPTMLHVACGIILSRSSLATRRRALPAQGRPCPPGRALPVASPRLNARPCLPACRLTKGHLVQLVPAAVHHGQPTRGHQRRIIERHTPEATHACMQQARRVHICAVPAAKAAPGCQLSILRNASLTSRRGHDTIHISNVNSTSHPRGDIHVCQK